MFFSIHNHTDEGSNLRLRDSTNKIPDLIEYAHSLGYAGLCITDHESITASLDAIKYFESRKDDWKDNFKLGLGNEIYLCPPNVTAENKMSNRYPHFILIALNAYGHKGIRELSTKAWSQNSFMHVMMRVPTYYSDLEEMLSKYKGNIIGSTACLGSSLSHAILDSRSNGELWQTCIDWIEYMKYLFGDEYFFLEMQPSHSEEQIYVNQKLLELSKITNTPYIISTDSHYLKKEDRKIHKIFIESQDGDREVDEFYASTYVMSEEEIHEYMDPYLGYEVVQQGIDNTQLIYDKIESYSLAKDLEIPYLPLNIEEPDEALYEKYKGKIELLSDFYNSPYDSDRHMIREILSYIDTDPHYTNDKGYEKINECLSYLKASSEKQNVRWSAYLMQVATYVKFAWEAGSIVGPGRGSGVGFCLLHILGITQINPLREKTQTFPWRFINPERASVLDIDIDICGSKRDAVIQGIQNVYGVDRVSKVMTLAREKSRSAIQTAGRGLGIDNDITQAIGSLIVSDRGQLRSLQQMYYGDADYEPSPDFIREMDKYPELWEAAQKIEGLVKGVGSHAGGVIIVDKPFTETTALMKTNSGDVITQFDLHMCEDCSLIKIDLLAIDALDKIQATIELLLKHGVIQWQGTLKATYEKYLGVYTLERDSLDMWQKLWNHEVMSFFQMEKESGIQAISLAKPRSVDDLATLNSVLRLMAQEKGAETPLEKYARFRNDINEWYKEMDEYGLTQKEQNILKKIIGISYGICEAQEYLVLLVQQPEIGGFSLGWGDKLRKAVAKKKPKEFMKLQEEFFANAEEKKLSKNLTNYVWNVLIYTQRGYGFNKSHTLAYSIIGLQELNICYKYNPIYWQTANLIVDSGAIDQNAGDSSNYSKIAIAMASAQKQGVHIASPLINTAEYGYSPDVEHNQIIFGLKGIKDINDDAVHLLIQNRPYTSMEDFYKRMIETGLIKKSQMLQLIKAGCFTELDNKNRRITMEYFLLHYVVKAITKLTLAQYSKIVAFMNSKYGAGLPKELFNSVTYKDFQDYCLQDCFLYKKYIDPKRKMVKAGYHDRWYKLDDIAMNFFKQNYSEDAIEAVDGEYYIISEKKFKKATAEKMEPLRNWMESKEALLWYQNCLLQEAIETYASGTVAKWEMNSLSIYCTQEHELAHIKRGLYGIENYFSLPEQPEIYDYYTKTIRQLDGTTETKQFPKHKIVRLAGTVLDKNKDRHTISLLTSEGVVTVKFNKGHFAYYDKQISHVDNKGVKTVIEKSWFARGSLLIVCGCRMGNQFFVKKYMDTVWKHTCNYITEVKENGELLVKTEREQ